MITHFRDLTVWQRGMSLAVDVYRLSAQFPKAELYGLTAQLRKAAVSIPSNIAEGHARASRKEYLHHISISQGSLAELETQLELARLLAYVAPESVRGPIDAAAVLGRQLHALRHSLEEK